MAKESICRNCFHSYVCEQFNENKDDSNEKCHFSNDHYVSTADVVPKSEVEMLQGALKAEERHNELTMEMAKKALANAKVEVAREIFEELKQKKKELWCSGKYTMFECWCKAEDEVKKKYTEEKE